MGTWWRSPVRPGSRSTRCPTCTSSYGSVPRRLTSTPWSSFRLAALPTLRLRPRRRLHLNRPLRRLLPSLRRLLRRLHLSHSPILHPPLHLSLSHKRRSRELSSFRPPTRSPTPLPGRRRPGSGSPSRRPTCRRSLGSTARPGIGRSLRGHRQLEQATSRWAGGMTARYARRGLRCGSMIRKQSAPGSSAIGPGVPPMSLRSCVRQRRFLSTARGARLGGGRRLGL